MFRHVAFLRSCVHTLRFFVAFVFLVGTALPARSASYSLTTVAGSDRVRDGEPAITVPLRSPGGTAQDASGNTYIADIRDHRVRKVDRDGVISTVAGTGRSGYSGDGGLAIEAELFSPRAVRIGPDGFLYIGDQGGLFNLGNSVIRRVDLKTGVITTFAGNGELAFAGDNGPALQAAFGALDFAFDSHGNLYIADTFNHRIRRIDALSGTIRTVAGLNVPGYSGNNGPAATAALGLPSGIAIDAADNIVFVDSGNFSVRKISAATGRITKVAGELVPFIFGDGGLAENAYLQSPVSVAVEANGDILIAGRKDVRRVSAADGIIRPVARSVAIGFGGDGGPPMNATHGGFDYVSAGPGGDILLSDYANSRVRRIRNGIIQTVAGIGIRNGVDATSTHLSAPEAIAPDGKGGIIFADRLHSMIRSVNAGRIERVYGDGYATAELTRLTFPEGVARDEFGNILISDTANHRILRFVPSGSASVVAGGNGSGYAGESGLATSARLSRPTSIVSAGGGIFYFVDLQNCRIRRVNNGAIATIAGNGACVFSGDDGPAVNAGVAAQDIALFGRKLYIADGFNNRIRMVDLDTGIIKTIAGVGSAGYAGDGQPANQAQLWYPVGIDVDANGNIYIAEYFNSVVRRIDAASGIIQTIAGIADEWVSSAESGPALAVAFDPVKVAVAPDGSIYVSDSYNDRIRKLTPAVVTSMTPVAGDGVTGEPGERITLSVRLRDSGQVAIIGETVNFAVASGAAVLSSASAITEVDGVASVLVTLGETEGPVSVTAIAAGLAPVTISLTIARSALPTPTIRSMGVVGAGLSVPSVQAMSTGAILSAFGDNFEAGATFVKVGLADLVDGRVPTRFRGLCIEVAGIRAGVFGASNTQVNFQAPRISGTGSVEVVIILDCDTPEERRSNAVTIAAQEASPEFFYFLLNEDGHNPVAATDTITGAGIGLFPLSSQTPARPGQYITVYATGFGETVPRVEPGTFYGGVARADAEVRVFLNGQLLPEANVLYAGATPNSPGLFQLNILIPEGTPDGDLRIVIEVNGISSPEGAYLTVRAVL